MKTALVPATRRPGARGIVADRDDPSALSYPPTFPLELAMRTAPVADICAAYGVDQAAWQGLKADPRFVADLKAAQELLREEGMSFRVKARMQAEELLKTSWRLIHAPTDEVPASVKADLIKFTVRAAGLDESAKKAQDTTAAPTFNLQINL
jgi:hypothetical protein